LVLNYLYVVHKNNYFPSTHHLIIRISFIYWETFGFCVKRLLKIAKSIYTRLHICPSVRLSLSVSPSVLSSVSAPVRLSERIKILTPIRQILDKFDILALSKNLLKNFNFQRIQNHNMFYINMFSHLWQYLNIFFLEWKIFRQNCSKNRNTHLIFSFIFFF
jgi:hypothetical protein